MANYPTSPSSNANLYVATNNLRTQLNGAINNAVTTITVDSTTGFQSAGLISIDTEVISYTSINATQFLGCSRGADGTVAASHADDAFVSLRVVAAHHNNLKDEMIAVETDLVAALASITPVSAGNTATSILNRLAQIVNQIKVGFNLTNWYDTPVPGSIPSGATMDFAGTTAPSGWLENDGSVVSQATYPALFTAIGTNFNTGGEGGGNFRLPNCARRTRVGRGGSGTGTLGNAVGNSGGAETHQLSSAEMPSHTHTQNSHNHTQDAHNHTQASHNHSTNMSTGGTGDGSVSFSGRNGFNTSLGTTSATPTINSNTATNQAATATNQNTGGDGSHNNLQPSIVFMSIIKI